MARPFKDPRGRHIRVYCDLLDCLAWRCLSWSARALFFDLRASLGRTNNGDIEAVLSKLKHRGWKSPSTLSDALYELLALGFLIKTRGGGVEAGSKVCSLYAFTDEPVLPFPKKGISAMEASHAYRHPGKTLAEVEELLHEGFKALRDRAVQRKQEAVDRKKTTLRKLERDDTDSVAVKASSATEIGAEATPALRKLEQTDTPMNRAADRASKGLRPIRTAKMAETPLLQKLDTFAIARVRGAGTGDPAAAHGVGIVPVQVQSAPKSAGGPQVAKRIDHADPLGRGLPARPFGLLEQLQARTAKEKAP